MHFFVFTFLLVMIAVSFVVMVKVFVAFCEDIRDRRWKWIPLHLITFPTVVAILFHFVDLMEKFVNA
ncbi:MAG: hypothetical protein ACRC6V_10420 [Bacteroidales bacterium]